jgi:hypothetical protein
MRKAMAEEGASIPQAAIPLCEFEQRTASYEKQAFL